MAIMDLSEREAIMTKLRAVEAELRLINEEEDCPLTSMDIEGVIVRLEAIIQKIQSRHC